MGRELKPLNVGDKFGKLTIVGKDYEKSEVKKKLYYFVQCECGSPVKSILKSTLLDKRHPVQSCGCLVREKAGFVEDRVFAIKKLLYIKMQDRHINSLHDSEDTLVSLDDFCVLSDQICHYCGAQPSSFLKDRRTGKVVYYNGLDRIDSNIGYRKTNVVPACKYCNIAKAELTDMQFKEHIKRIHMYQRKKKNEGKI